MATRLAGRRNPVTPGHAQQVPATWRARALGAVVVVLGLVVAAAGMTFTVRHRQHVAQTTQVASATLGGLTATPRQVIWAEMQDDQMNATDGYQMPPQMMPGMPTGDQMRLGISITLANTGPQLQSFDLNTEFLLGGGKIDPPRPLQVDSFGGLPRLNGRSVVSGVLYFDIKPPAPGDPPLYLLWKRAGQQRRLLIHVPATMQMTDAPPNSSPEPSSQATSK